MTARQCFPCTACCEGWIDAEIEGVRVSPDSPCVNCKNHGCSIYKTRPVSPCRDFKCGWLMEQSPLPEEMKPVDCGAIVLLDRDWHGQEVIRAVPIGSSIPDDTLEWLMRYAQEKPIPLIYGKRTTKKGKFGVMKATYYGPPSFLQAVRTTIEPADIFTM